MIIAAAAGYVYWYLIYGMPSATLWRSFIPRMRETEAERWCQIPAEPSHALQRTQHPCQPICAPHLAQNLWLVPSLGKFGNLPGQKLFGQVIIFNNVPASSSSLSEPCHTFSTSGSTCHFSAVSPPVESLEWTMHYLSFRPFGQLQD